MHSLRGAQSQRRIPETCSEVRRNPSWENKNTPSCCRVNDNTPEGGYFENTMVITTGRVTKRLPCSYGTKSQGPKANIYRGAFREGCTSKHSRDLFGSSEEWHDENKPLGRFRWAGYSKAVGCASYPSLSLAGIKESTNPGKEIPEGLQKAATDHR